MGHKKTNSHTIVGVLILLTTLSGTVSANEKEAACKPSKWGPDDQIGSANLINPERVIAASKLIKHGRTAHLGMIVDKDTPAFPPRRLSMQIIQPGQEFGRQPYPNGFTYNDDVFQGWFGIGSQIDGLAHAGHHDVFYNCLRGKEFVQVEGVSRLGVEQIPPMVGRAVLLDMAGHRGVRHLDGGQYFTAADVREVSEHQGTPIGEGDIVIFYTGWTEHVFPTDPQRWGSVEPGMAEDVASYLAELNVLAVGADTWGVDVVPPENPDRPFQGHITLLKENGIYILENMNVGPLVSDGVEEFMFVLGPIRVRGAVQSMANPIALY